MKRVLIALLVAAAASISSCAAATPSAATSLSAAVTPSVVLTPSAASTPNGASTPNAAATPSAVGTPSAAARGPITIWAWPVGGPRALAKLDQGPLGKRVGIAWIFYWREIEPSPGVYNWSRIDQALAAGAGRPQSVRVEAGRSSPDWIYASVPSISVSNRNLFHGPKSPALPIKIPVTWSAQFIGAWTKFIAAFGARFGSDPRLNMVQMPGAGWQVEMDLPHLPSGGVWGGYLAQGYTDAKLISSWEQIINSYLAAFPSKTLAINVGEPMGSGNSNVMQPVLSWLRSLPNGHVDIQNDSLHAATKYPIVNTLKAASAWTTVGWQTWGPKGRNGDLLTALKIGLSANARYFEIDLGDLECSCNAGILRWLVAQ